MQTEIYIDPKIDLYSDKTIEVLIEFKIKPAKVAVATSVSGITIEQATKQVEESHHIFKEDLTYLNELHIKYAINHTYKDSFNGVSMSLKGNTIQYLLQSTVIKAIYSNKEMKIPPKPVDTMYQV